MTVSTYPRASSPCSIGPVELPNRIVFPPWQVNYANTDGTVSEKLKDFYLGLARGGCGLIITGCAVVSADGVPFDRVLHADEEKHVPGLRDLFAAIEGYGVVPGIQLVHYGRQSSSTVSGDTLLAPSAIPCPVMSQFDPDHRVREMNQEDITFIRDAFVQAAERAVRAGAKLIEVHAAHGYLLAEFLSPYSNRRDDEYGGSPEKRVRLVAEVVEGIRAEIGDRAAISVRVSGDEFVDGGLKPEDFRDLVPVLEDAGMDMLHVCAGVYESMERIVPPEHLGQTPHRDIARTIKAFTRVPVCAVGSIRSLGTAESFLNDGVADLCAMGRAQVADPEIVRKSFEGRHVEIRQCNHCNSCTFWTTGDPEMYCAVNPDYMKPLTMGGLRATP